MLTKVQTLGDKTKEQNIRIYLTRPKLMIPHEVCGQDLSFALLNRTLLQATHPSHDTLLSHGHPHSNNSLNPFSHSLSPSSNLPLLT
ncbi:hypothetical protein HanRHA438_Chr16g0778661 [Helianthus annuus]|nr:hypothetical protein HanRHA438_Chr16g0778661 [Helianthus annuus]